MKKVIQLWIGTLLLILLAACGATTDKDSSTEQIDQSASTRKSKPVNSEPIADQLETMETHGIAEKARYSFTLKQNDKSYHLYIYSDDEVETKTEEDWACANKGDLIYKGDYSVAVVEKDTDQAAVLSIGKHTFQVPNDGVDVIDGDPSLLVVSHCEASDMFSAELFAIDDAGKPYQLRDGDGHKLIMNVSPARIKSIGKNKYQTAVFSNASEPNWGFENWELYPAQASMFRTGINIPVDPAKLDVTKWMEDPDYIVK